MGHYDTNVISIFAGGVFSGEPVMREYRSRIRAAAARYSGAKSNRVWSSDACKLHNGWKGTQVVIAGVFNYWEPQQARRFALALSRAFPGCEVTFAGWCEYDNELHSCLFLDGKDITETTEHPLWESIRRVAG